MKGRITIFSIVGCRHCLHAKSTLKERSLSYVDVSLDKYHSSVREELQRLTGKTSVPQIFFNEIHIGGNVELQNLLDTPRFSELVDKVTNEPTSPETPGIPDDRLLILDGSNADVDTQFKCEKDEYAQIAEAISASSISKTHWRSCRCHRNTFTGSDFVTWRMTTTGVTYSEGIHVGQMLLDRHFIRRIGGDSGEAFRGDDAIYRLLEDDHFDALNAGEISECEPPEVGSLGEQIRKLILRLYNENISPDGKSVDYKGIAASEDFTVYTALTKQLQRLPIERANTEERLAFFINIYNALVIHGNVVRGHPSSLWQRYRFFNNVRYIVGGHQYSLQDMENGVLRANRAGVGQLFRPFGRGDPRRATCLPQHEPLIHFALNCGAKSCPPIKTYSAAAIYDELSLAARSFLDTDEAVTLTADGGVRLSMIFKWYAEDFGDNSRQLLRWIAAAMQPGGEKRQELESRLQATESRGKIGVSYLPYDWGTNS